MAGCRIVFQLLAQSKAVFPRHHDIRDDQIRHEVVSFLPAFDAVFCLIHPVFCSKDSFYLLPKFFIVLNY